MSVSKKLISVALAVLMVLIAMPVSNIDSFASDPTDFSYTVISETEKLAELSGYSGSGGNVVIPSTIDGYSIVSISDFAFGDENDSILSLTIPDSVQAIGLYSLAVLMACSSFEVSTDNQYFCSVDGVVFNKNMTELVKFPDSKNVSTYTVPSTVQSLRHLAFALCFNLTAINLPSTLTEIGEYAFYYCVSLESISIPSGVTSLSNYAFSECASLTSVSLPGSLEEIMYCCFENCSSLNEITLFDNVTYISDSAFSGSGLTTVYGVSGSYAQTFANNNSFTFVAISNTPGDMNNDTLCNYKDIEVMVQIAAGFAEPTAIQMTLGDMNNDGVIDGFDAAALDRLVYKDID